MSWKQKAQWVIGFSAVLLVISCTTKLGKDVASKDKNLRSVASTDLAAASCESTESLDWFNDGKYAVSASKKNEKTQPFNFAAYDPTYKPLERKLVEEWSSKFSKTNADPKNRSEFFSRGTMYYFEIVKMDDEYKGTESNFKLLGPKVVGANSKINVYRIDNLKGNDKDKDLEECPNFNDKKPFATIPFFSMRTSGNRTNQMPKSSFKIKTLSQKKWKKLATAQYEENTDILMKAAAEVNNLALAFQELLGEDLSSQGLRDLRLGSKDEFLRWFSSTKFNEDQQWKAGQIRNGMLWWKGQLEYAASVVSKEDIVEIYKEMDGEPAKILKAAQKENSSKGWKEKIEDRLREEASESKDFLGMDSLNFKAMWNDPSQMREALAWYMFEKGGVPAPRQTYAKLCFGKTYRGLFSVIEQIDESFLKDRHITDNADTANIYKVYMGTEDVGLEVKDLEAAFAGLDLTQFKDGAIEKMKIVNAFVDNPYRGKKALEQSPFANLNPFATWLSQSEYFFKNLGGGTLQKLDRVSSAQVSPYFKSETIENRTYQLQTDWEGAMADHFEENILPQDPDYRELKKELKPKKFKDWQKKKTAKYMKEHFLQKLPPAANYQDLAQLIDAINSGDFKSPEYFQKMNQILDTKLLLRWAALTVLLGGWDNYYMNPQNFYLVNKTSYSPLGQAKDGAKGPKFILLPWDYDQSFSMSFGDRATLWWNTDILNWESMRGEKRPDKSGLDENTKAEYQALIQRPLIMNMLENKRFRDYYLKYMEWMIYNYFHVNNVTSLIGKNFDLSVKDLNAWRSAYAGGLQNRQRQHVARLSKEVWDDPAVNAENFRSKLNERLVREISSPESHQEWFQDVSPRSNESHLMWENFQAPLDERAAGSRAASGASADRCDQETYVEPRSEKDIGQCEARSSHVAPVYPTGWRSADRKPLKKGIWNLIGKAIYEENMGLPRPRWDIMSRTGRQYRNELIYDNGFLGRRVVWKELWQENPEKCNRQYKIFEGIEHHVRERVRTALQQISEQKDVYGDEEQRLSILEGTAAEIPL